MNKVVSGAKRRWQSWQERWPLPSFLRPPTQPDEHLERAVGGAFSRVQPPLGFRRDLADNLTLAAHDRISGLTVTDPRSFNATVLFGVMITLVVGSLLTGVLVVRSALPKGQR